MRTVRKVRRDTLKVTGDDGQEILIMKAVRDDRTGEMVASDVLDAAVVTARFRNVAERHGLVDLRFEVTVPAAMQDRRWQVRLYPDMFIMEDSLRLDAVVLTGDEFRKTQLRGYQQYEKFLASIISDTTRFIDRRNLEIFIQRNLPQLYKFRSDTSVVSDETFLSYYGVTEKEAIDHYTLWWWYRRNERRRARSGEMYGKYVRNPIVTEGIRLDSVVRNPDGDFVYHYVQTIATRPRLRKVDIVLSGEIRDRDKRLYTMHPSPPLTFYISSVSTLVDEREKYLSKVIGRRADASTACYVEFASGRSDIDLTLGHNREEIGRIKGNIRELLANTTFDLDSMVIAASASPEGSETMNRRLSASRAASIGRYLENYVREWRDSVRREGFSVDAESGLTSYSDAPGIAFRSRSLGENWEMLTRLVDMDTVLTRSNILSFTKHLEISDLDTRESAISREGYYRYLRENLYPRLRTVRFDFFLHRKGMIRDTLMTTEIDTAYMNGIKSLKDRDYESAIKALAPYRDYNTAVACVALDRNATAMQILSSLERTPRVKYMLAILYSRAGDDEKAVDSYLSACREDPSFVHRGNLDPEIHSLIKSYNLSKEDGAEDDLLL